MKQRILGLLALVLCMVTVMTSAMAIIPMTYVVEGESLEPGSLVRGRLWVDIQPDPAGTDFTLEDTAGFWRVLQADNDFEKEPTGNVLFSSNLSLNDYLYGGLFVLGFDSIATPVYSEFTSSDIKAQLETYLNQKYAGFTPAWYDIGLYQETSYGYKPGEWYECGNLLTFTIPFASGEPVAVLHWMGDNDIVEENFVQNSEGVQLSVEHFSPFVVVYKPNATGSVPVPSTGDNTRLTLLLSLSCLSLWGAIALNMKRKKHI